MRVHSVPKSYLMSVADALHRTNPSLEIIYNTLKDVYEVSYNDGYTRRITDAKVFKDKQDTRTLSEWNSIKDTIDDEIHSKNQ